MIYIHVASTKVDYKLAKALIEEYAGSLDIDLSFQRFDSELVSLEKMYGPPHGGILCAVDNGLYIGTAGVRRISPEIGELKRMYVKPAYQGKGVGKMLLEEAINLAKKCGYQKLWLDTLNTMEAAMLLYKNAGFNEIPAYYANPNETVVYFEKLL